jgi:hypothetical protein
MPDDFTLLDAEFHSPMQSPDEALDLIFMLDPSEWTALEQAWTERPRQWRENCAYVLHYGPPEKCIPLLRRAIFDSEGEVALEAALSLAVQFQETGTTTLGDDEQRRLIGLAQRPDAKDLEELHQLLATMDTP